MDTDLAAEAEASLWPYTETQRTATETKQRRNHNLAIIQSVIEKATKNLLVERDELWKTIRELTSRAAHASECDHEWIYAFTLSSKGEPPIKIDQCVRCGVEQKQSAHASELKLASLTMTRSPEEQAAIESGETFTDEQGQVWEELKPAHASEQCPKCDQLPAACKCEKPAHASEKVAVGLLREAREVLNRISLSSDLVKRIDKYLSQRPTPATASEQAIEQQKAVAMTRVCLWRLREELRAIEDAKGKDAVPAYLRRCIDHLSIFEATPATASEQAHSFPSDGAGFLTATVIDAAMKEQTGKT
jgi:hypothetical protein